MAVETKFDNVNKFQNYGTLKFQYLRVMAGKYIILFSKDFVEVATISVATAQYHLVLDLLPPVAI